MRQLFLIFSLLLFLMSTNSVKGQEFSAMTYNIRYNTPNDGENWWENRKEWLSDVVNFYEPDVMGIQEGLHEQVLFLDSALVGYEYTGIGRDDGKTEGEYAALFFKSDKLEIVEEGTFWLSETPDEPSFGWGANFRRISTWARFRSKETNQEFWVFNAHFDHETPLARMNSAKLILERISRRNNENLPVIVMGDLNATPEAPPIQLLASVLNDSRKVSKNTPIGPIGTFNGFDTNHPLDNRIDYIFVDSSVVVTKYAVISETREKRTPSDHLPVYIKFNLD